VEKLKQRLREEITRTQAGVRLDLNLEKGRIRDESGQQELKIKEVDTRIESEIAGLRTQIEQAKFSILQYLVGVATGAGALLLAYMRMMVSSSRGAGGLELTGRDERAVLACGYYERFGEDCIYPASIQCILTCSRGCSLVGQRGAI